MTSTRSITAKCSALLVAAAAHPQGRIEAKTVSQADALKRAGYTETAADGHRVINAAGRAYVASIG